MHALIHSSHRHPTPAGPPQYRHVGCRGTSPHLTPTAGTQSTHASPPSNWHSVHAALTHMGWRVRLHREVVKKGFKEGRTDGGDQPQGSVRQAYWLALFYTRLAPFIPISVCSSLCSSRFLPLNISSSLRTDLPTPTAPVQHSGSSPAPSQSLQL